MLRVNPAFIQKIDPEGAPNAIACMNCGTCTALCPMGLTSLPREILRYTVLGLEDKIHEHTETIFSCLLCRLCEANCPSQVKIVDKVRALRVYLHPSGRIQGKD